ncbi:TetR/AcrR family transcriptional regulator [Rhodococcus sp. MEB064]|uniref:TetR/AcrR family transcriptional regulator n=1 Tax=Rhodococcus sp. MEB064 TaxID=1587522 RepID=UPI0005AC5EB5|nr:TetR/AcrR family transcriptional regulator [Rhodococcus sp. MEB064]KIQ18453.1 TetR family transcriptional regulator [Rhodococcus sp. MEB064]
MPKLVDHDERRRAIAAATWRLIASKGIDAANMRDIAAAAGYTNGALSHYFSGKDEIVRAAFELVSEATDERAASVAGDAKGLAALRVLCMEVMPTTAETVLEARIAVSLWHRAMYDQHLEDANRRTLEHWRLSMSQHLDDARELHEIGDIDVALTVEQLLNMTMGMQVLGVLTPERTSPTRQIAMVDDFIDRLRH